MNSKDRDNIGYILANNNTFEEIRQALFELDNGIRNSTKSFEYIQGRDEQVGKVYEEKMESLLGKNWTFKKKAIRDLICNQKEVLEEARKEVYGDDYHPSLFKR